ncbi:hypothetical protein LZP73_01330 [Shewanella sp. AS16]|uniref:hypothetical protein n=1 Tax=Shewanella sp. AS16 TaxID=2907625 RepID=UPI001F27BCE8|nr:hypothetical protein [Shewanella sp. AS16]MCE9684854.1 hypothetical protein [Shewanella sp. AS16]
MTNIGGKVIDGYVSGATVWLDINGNGVFDESEPKTISEAGGDYNLELSEELKECISYSNLYVDVPVGALDEDTGLVTEAYQMMLPARLSPLTDEAIFNISPLTTVLADVIKADLAKENSNAVSCSALKENTELRNSIQSKLDEAIRNLVAHYNIAADTIFADFIHAEDDVTKQLALNIVKGLKASYTFMTTAKAKYPDASYIRVEYFQGSESDSNNAYPDAWYRQTAAWLPDGFASELVKMSDDLSQEVRPIYLRKVIDKAWGTGKLSITHDIASQGGDDSPYTCSSSEAVSVTKDGVNYKLDNGSSGGQADTMEDCVNDGLVRDPRRYFYVDYQAQGIGYDARFDVGEAQSDYYALPDWTQLEDKAQPLDFSELIAHFETLEYKFDTPVDNSRYEAWSKRSTDDSHGNRVQIDKSSTGQWERLSYHDDGTYLKECSQDGVTWGTCS